MLQFLERSRESGTKPFVSRGTASTIPKLNYILSNFTKITTHTRTRSNYPSTLRKGIITPGAISRSPPRPNNPPADLQRAVSLCLYFRNKRSTSFARGETRRLIFAREVGCLAADRSASFVFTLRVKSVAPCIKPDNPRAEDPKPHKHRYAALRRPHPPPSIPKLLTPIYTPVHQPLEINPYRIRAGARTRFQPNWPPLSKLQIVESLSYFCEHGDTILFQIGNFLEIF